MMMIEWGRCAAWIASALHAGGEPYKLKDVRERIESGDAQFWPGQRCAAVSRVIQHPRGRVLRIWLAGGDLGELSRMLGFADEYARDNDCVAVEVEGRKGWERVLSDYRPTSVVLRKEVN